MNTQKLKKILIDELQKGSDHYSLNRQIIISLKSENQQLREAMEESDQEIKTLRKYLNTTTQALLSANEFLRAHVSKVRCDKIDKNVRFIIKKFNLAEEEN